MKPLLPAAFAAIALTACTSPAGMELVRLDPVPYAMALPPQIARRLFTAEIEGPLAEDARSSGAIATRAVLYQPEAGPPVTAIDVFLFPAAAFDAARNPAEPPRFGTEVRRAGGTTLSVAGPQDSIFDPGSRDGKNIGALYELVYRPSTYRPTVE